MHLRTTLEQIKPLNQEAMATARHHQNLLAIPQGSLGRLHDLCIQLAGITGDPRPGLRHLAVVTMAGDHGVTRQGISLFPQAVTREMVANFTRGGASINVLARHFNVRLTVVDMGVAGPPLDICIIPDQSRQDLPIRLLHHRIGDGTADISEGPAMTREQAVYALETGIAVFEQEKARGLHAIGTGDMGIGNTTPSAAMAASLLGEDPACLINRGTGIDDCALANKGRIVARALEVNRPDPEDPLDVLTKVGGFEIGGIAGLMLAAAAHRVPVMVDGFISTSAALLASKFHPEVKHYLFSGHQSAVEGHGLMLDHLGLTPLVDLGLRLGEGTGAVYGLSILASASRIAQEMLTFEQAAVSLPNAETGQRG
ncbi:MAG: nicotinate-nucleotide--dimethylbenzimidazole phosphoribosyltransferase [Deltaproteobacteria bacterium]|nr:nicotinate-nucleotide--dimethylbenzimidazole phosphoribosyltransferase [Deltaproteobacteria bacterium]